MRDGTTETIQIPSIPGYKTTIEVVREHLAEWEPKVAEFAKKLEQIKAELPPEFFTS